ncbi:MAG: DNA-processing protein DprA [Brucellaceae bacterium]|jgi:DNA processing protein|nr:DNA-processing protein DprA [Brucellaceae bacterium]
MIRETGSQVKGIRLSDQQRLNWLRLIRSDNVGSASFRDLIAYCGSAAAALERLPELVRSTAKRPLRIHSQQEAEQELEAIDRAGAKLIGMGEPDYPSYLRQMLNPPPLVTVLGNTALFSKPPVAIVGARNASATACAFTSQLVRDLGAEGFAIVSGFARGIDTAAHKASLETGTIAVLAGGLDRPYPPENIPLLDRIIDHGGMIISEMPMGWVPRAQDFPRRNRIIAGLSLGLAVIEAAQRSGSLISARLAGEMGRLVFAVPGSPLDPRASGTNSLLKNGAIMLTEAQDIRDALAPMLRTDGTAPQQAGFVFSENAAPIAAHSISLNTDADVPSFSGSANLERIRNALSSTPASVDAIIRHTSLPAAAVHLALLELDLAGQLQRGNDGLVALLPS